MRKRAASVFGALALAAIAVQGQGVVNFEGKQTSPIALSPDGTRLFAVNTPDHRVSVFDLSDPSDPVLFAEIPVGLEPVSVRAVSREEAWVVNECSDSVSVVSVSQRRVLATLPVGDEPADVVFAQNRAFVTAGRQNELHVFDRATRERIQVMPLQGENPRALAVGPDGRSVYVAFALSGNGTTILPSSKAPPQPMPNRVTNAPPQVGLIVDAEDTNWSWAVPYRVVDHDVAEIEVQSLTVTRYFRKVGTVNLGLAVHPTDGRVYVANTDARNLVRFEPALRGHFAVNQLSRLDPAEGALGAVARFDLNPGIDYAVKPNPAARALALAQPTALAFHPSGQHLYLAAFGSDRIARVDADGKVLFRIELSPGGPEAVEPRNKRGPRGLALNAERERLYVLNRIANSIAVIDTRTDRVIRELPTGSYDPTPAAIREGRGFLYDARLSGNGTVSCATCHVDAEMDLLAWDLGDPDGSMEEFTAATGPDTQARRERHPMKGPLTTQTLRGLRGMDPLHWRGDRTNFLHFNGAFDSLMGGTPLPPADMQAYRDFINTIIFAPNPNRALDNSLSTNLAGGNARVGSNLFYNVEFRPNVTCSGCHDGRTGISTSGRPMVDASVLNLSQGFKIPHLRNLYQKAHFLNGPGEETTIGFGLTPDGSAGNLMELHQQARFGRFATNTAVQRDLQAFLLSFDTGLPSAVGQALTLTSTNVNLPAVAEAWITLENQPSSRVQLIARGELDGSIRGLLYSRSDRVYQTDTTGVGPLTRAQLTERILAGATLTLMAVPSGMGPRLALDRTLDGILDGDASPPAIAIERGTSGTVLSWTARQGFYLESSPELASEAWKPLSIPMASPGAALRATNQITAPQQFFRSRSY